MFGAGAKAQKMDYFWFTFRNGIENGIKAEDEYGKHSLSMLWVSKTDNLSSWNKSPSSTLSGARKVASAANRYLESGTEKSRIRWRLGNMKDPLSACLRTIWSVVKMKITSLLERERYHCRHFNHFKIPEWYSRISTVTKLWYEFSKVLLRRVIT